MTEHTPGPWKIDGTYIVNPLGDTPKGHYSIAECSFHNGARAECDANARLIASAPDLLAACLAVSEEATDANRNGDIIVPSHVWDLIAQALNKALGTELHRFDIASDAKATA